MARGLQFHVQRSPSFAAFAGDVAGLRAACRAVIATGSFDEVGFQGDPRFVTAPARRVRRASRRLSVDGAAVPMTAVLQKPAGTVVCITDFGIGTHRDGSGSAPSSTWLQHHDDVAGAGARLVYLVPYPPERWPSELRRLPAVFWTDGVRAVDTVVAMHRRVR